MNRVRCFLTPSLRRSIFTTTILLTTTSTLQRSFIPAAAFSPNVSGTGSSASESSSSNNHNQRMSSSSDTKVKTAQELKIQWAGGRDIWPRVPVRVPVSGGEHEENFVSIQTKIKQDSDDNTNTHSNTDTNSEWPDIVKHSVLFGFGAYNPRGQTMPDEINLQQHALLQKDMSETISPPAVYWEAAALWEDGSFERGFMVAFPKPNSVSSPSPSIQEGKDICIQLAKKYNQGAIYKYEMESASSGQEEGSRERLRLMRDTVAVLDEGTDARVEVEIDNDADLSSFMEIIR